MSRALPEKIAVASAHLCGIAVLVAGLVSSWSFMATMTATLGTIAAGLLVGRVASRPQACDRDSQKAETNT